MIELKTYLTGILKSIEKDYDAEDVRFEITDDGYRILFKAETTKDKDVETDRRGEWYRDHEIIVKLGKKYFKEWEYNEWMGVCPCDNCKTVVIDKNVVAPSSSGTVIEDDITNINKTTSMNTTFDS